ncbi:MAG: hypothetical protein AAFY26_18150 [Cyanobacteria bacterium J06638_22]
MTLQKSNTRFAFVVSLLTLFPIGEYVPNLSVIAPAQTSTPAFQDSFTDYDGFDERIQRLQADLASLRSEVGACELLAAELEAGADLGPRYADCLQLSERANGVEQDLEQAIAENRGMGEFSDYGPLLERLSAETASVVGQVYRLIAWLENIGLRKEQEAQLEELRQAIATLRVDVDVCARLINAGEVLSENQRQWCEGLESPLQTLQAEHDALSYEITDRWGREELGVLSDELDALDAILPLTLPARPNEPGSEVFPGDDASIPPPDNGPGEPGEGTDGSDAGDDESLVDPLPSDAENDSAEEESITDEAPDEEVLDTGVNASDEEPSQTDEIPGTNPQPFPRWILLVAGAILGSTATYWIQRKRLRAKAEKPESLPELTVRFEPHFDPGMQRISSPRSLKLDFDIKFVPSMKAGAQTIKAPNGLVEATRRVKAPTHVS